MTAPAGGEVIVRVDRDTLEVEVLVPEPVPDLGDIADRVTTLAGTLTTSGDGATARVVARLPLPGPDLG